VTLPDLITCLDGLGVRFGVGLGARLTVDAPRGALTDEIKAALSEHKPVLLQRLVGELQEDKSSRSSDPEPSVAGSVQAAQAVLGEPRAVAPDPVPEPGDPWPCDPALLPASAKGAWPPRAPELATWPTSWRERWARRTKELEAAGERWQWAEQAAFIYIAAERLAAGLPVYGLPWELDPEDELPAVVEARPSSRPTRPRPAPYLARLFDGALMNEERRLSEENLP
jgi:hypothetical protein